MNSFELIVIAIEQEIKDVFTKADKKKTTNRLNRAELNKLDELYAELEAYEQLRKYI